jgi:hypothetical protein
MVLLGSRFNLKLVSVCMMIVLILTQGRCMVCAKRTIGWEIILDAPDGTPNNVGHVESHFSSFGCKIGARFAPNIP